MRTKPSHAESVSLARSPQDGSSCPASSHSNGVLARLWILPEPTSANRSARVSQRRHRRTRQGARWTSGRVERRRLDDLRSPKFFSTRSIERALDFERDVILSLTHHDCDVGRPHRPERLTVLKRNRSDRRDWNGVRRGSVGVLHCRLDCGCNLESGEQ